MMHVNYPGFSTFLLFFLFSSSIQSLPCHRAQHLCRHKNQNGSRLVCVFVCFVCVCAHTHEFASVLVLAFALIYTCTKFFFFLFFFFKCSIFEMCMFGLFSVFIYILCQYACFEHNESIKVFFFSIMSKKQQQKVGLCKKSSSTDAKAKEEKKRHLRRKTKINKQTKKPDNSGILLSVTQSFSGFPGGSRDHPSFMICSRARSLCTFTALVEIRCCGPSSCDTERERKEEKKTGENKESGFSGAVANMLRVAGSWLSHRLTGTANSMRNRRGREKKKRSVSITTRNKWARGGVGNLCFNHMEQTSTL